jgi:prevent-host-death family protein
MVEVTVDAAELKERLDEYLARVRDGVTVVITEDGKPLARVLPEAEPEMPEPWLQKLIDSGRVQWGGGRLEDIEPPAKLRPGGKTMAEIVSDLRD